MGLGLKNYKFFARAAMNIKNILLSSIIVLFFYNTYSSSGLQLFTDLQPSIKIQSPVAFPSEAQQVAAAIYTKELSRKAVVQKLLCHEIKATVRADEIDHKGKRIVFTFRDGSEMLNIPFEEASLDDCFAHIEIAKSKELQRFKAILQGHKEFFFSNIMQADWVVYKLNSNTLSKGDFIAKILQKELDVKVKVIGDQSTGKRVRFTMADGSSFLSPLWSNKELLSLPLLKDSITLSHVLTGNSVWEFQSSRTAKK